MFENLSELKNIIMISGGMLLFIGIALLIYFRAVYSRSESFRATVTGFRKMASRNYDYTSCPTVEFDFNGRLITSYYYRYMFNEEIDFEIGDTFTILVNPRMPKTFRFENDEKNYNPTSFIILSAIGLVFLIVGIII